MEESNPLLEELDFDTSYSKVGLTDLLLSVNSTTEGLNAKQLKAKQDERGQDSATIPKPIEAPEWLCCILPCLDASHDMLEYKRCVNQQCVVKRAGRGWMNMDVSGLLVGDLVKVNDGYIVPADIRIINCVGKCTLDPSYVTGAGTYTANENESGDVYQYSPNMAFAGYRCEGGDFSGIVVATGGDTLLGRMIKRGLWPETSKNFVINL